MGDEGAMHLMPIANQERKITLLGIGFGGSLDAVGVIVIGVVAVGVAGGAGGGIKVWSSGGSMAQG